MTEVVSERLENIVGKGESAGNSIFSFSLNALTVFFLKVIRGRNYAVKGLTLCQTTKF